MGATRGGIPDIQWEKVFSDPDAFQKLRQFLVQQSERGEAAERLRAKKLLDYLWMSSLGGLGRWVLHSEIQMELTFGVVDAKARGIDITQKGLEEAYRKILKHSSETGKITKKHTKQILLEFGKRPPRKRKVYSPMGLLRRVASRLVKAQYNQWKAAGQPLLRSDLERNATAAVESFLTRKQEKPDGKDYPSSTDDNVKRAIKEALDKVMKKM